MILTPPRGPSVRPARVLLADDEAMVRAGVRAILDTDAGITLVAEATAATHVRGQLTLGCDN
ncbi:hypothetical protein SAMN05421810_11810 [Amycolatopsis arida]|uniref:Response regulatory domain-containing protein n=1 Tax=Amycolatopsis arida TaxID=587909 RepID=A0A1I6B0R0_9PSEU|nr:hypothetical protein CLV69_11920 [Amycolatopsis arida]SFQ74515.1 hypothetical protein SAMN05421810_11810 [Amycolatopsis arida]